ncbi:hypothetical protein [Streptomyces alkaliterrae]|uniref:Lipoprotein n=1 Tax=Streptomyces alkaliterrae TaxID=2213162 RepID=A0A5P0YTX9_9ACTN|nr:hypothetical protein [Streptomyces alkaliterrae]MBB1256025.1 hypothetical protein [Streptomyces alkaliterrae]MBB1262019.1 hypothetical protein [Streptomyces alkaliterrae]MQS03773.1 hypothetical protein [Streptomyces alkaliterrae]
MPAFTRRIRAALTLTSATALLVVGCSTGNNKELAEEHFKFAAKGKWAEACALESDAFRGGSTKDCSEARKGEQPEGLRELSTDDMRSKYVTPARGNKAAEEGDWVLISFRGDGSTEHRAVQVLKDKINDVRPTSEDQWQNKE